MCFTRVHGVRRPSVASPIPITAVELSGQANGACEFLLVWPARPTRHIYSQCTREPRQQRCLAPRPGWLRRSWARLLAPPSGMCRPLFLGSLIPTASSVRRRLGLLPATSSSKRRTRLSSALSVVSPPRLAYSPHVAPHVLKALKVMAALRGQRGSIGVFLRGVLLDSYAAFLLFPAREPGVHENILEPSLPNLVGMPNCRGVADEDTNTCLSVMRLTFLGRMSDRRDPTL